MRWKESSAIPVWTEHKGALTLSLYNVVLALRSMTQLNFANYEDTVGLVITTLLATTTHKLVVS